MATFAQHTLAPASLQSPADRQTRGGAQASTGSAGGDVRSGFAMRRPVKPMPMEMPLQVAPAWLEPSASMSEELRGLRRRTRREATVIDERERASGCRCRVANRTKNSMLETR